VGVQARAVQERHDGVGESSRLGVAVLQRADRAPLGGDEGETARGSATASSAAGEEVELVHSDIVRHPRADEHTRLEIAGDTRRKLGP
jgi:hypothetical protein